MNRKHNPWVALVAMLLMAVILVLALTGCNGTAEAAGTTETENSRHFKVEWQAINPLVGSIYTITDTETGVEYIVVHDGQGVGIAKLEPAAESEEAET